MVVIDYRSMIEVEESSAFNELTTLRTLAMGLNQLYIQVAEIELPIRKYEEEHRKRVFSFGLEHFGFPQESERLVSCYFHWFGVSICNYIRLVGFVDGVARGLIDRTQIGDSSQKKFVRAHCDTYVKSIAAIQPVLHWRNKAYAHFALTAPYNEDSPALLDVSTMSIVSYSRGRIRSGNGIIFSQNDDEVAMPDWSLTEVYEDLSQQFWPERMS